MNSTVIASSSLLLALAAGPAVAQEGDPQAIVGEHFTILPVGEPAELMEAIGKEVLDTAEATWKTQMELYGLKKATISEPWAIHAYRFTNNFDDKDLDLNDGFAKEDKEYFFHVEGTRELHLGLFPYIHDEVISKYGVPLQCLRTLIAQITKIIRLETTEAAKLYPPWFTDGLDLLIAERVLKDMKRVPDLAYEDPNTAVYFSQVKSLNRKTRLPSPADLILGNTADLEDSQGGLGYVWASWVLGGKQKKRLSKLITNMLAIPADDGYTDRYAKVAKKAFNKGTLKNLDRDFKKYMRTVESPWRYEFSESQFNGDTILQIADEDAPASCISNQRPSKPVYKITGTVTILKDWATHRANLVLGKRDNEDYLLLSLISTEDNKGIFLYHLTDGEWVTLKEFPNQGILPDKPMEFSFEMRRQRHMAFILDGVEIFDFKFERAMTAGWGLQADAGGTVLWEGVKLVEK